MSLYSPAQMRHLYFQNTYKVSNSCKVHLFEVENREQLDSNLLMNYSFVEVVTAKNELAMNKTGDLLVP